MDYKRHYDALIKRAQTRTLDGYVERHHILPRCMGGSDDPDNIATLTPEEHYVAHQLLVKIHPDEAKMVFAALAMTRGRSGNKRYGWLRRLFAQRISEINKGKPKPPMTEEHRRNIGLAQLGRIRGPHSDCHKARLSQAHTGKTLTAEHRAKLAEAKVGKKQSLEFVERRVGKTRGKPRQFTEEHMANVIAASRRVQTCPHCEKTGIGSSMNRWHFDNCKVAAHG